jgi:hypothetical protein
MTLPDSIWIALNQCPTCGARGFPCWPCSDKVQKRIDEIVKQLIEARKSLAAPLS